MTSGSCVPPILLPEHALVARRLIRAWVLTAIIFLALFLTWGYLPLDAVRPFGGSAFGASLPFQPTSSEAMFTFHGWETTLGFGPISLPAWFLLVCSLALTFLITLEESGRPAPALAIPLLLLVGNLLACLPLVCFFGGGYPGLGSVATLFCLFYWALKEWRARSRSSRGARGERPVAP